MTAVGNNDEFDVAVVGWGPTGQMASILLGEMGHRVAAFERWSGIYPLPRAVHYDDEIARLFQKAGLSDEVREITDPVPDFYEWRNRDGETLLSIDWSARGISGWPVANFFSQPDLQKVLDEKARSLATVEVNNGWEAREISHHADHVELTVRKGHPGRGGAWVPDGETRTVRARYLVGADGLVRESMGAPVTDLGFDFDWLILDVIPHEERVWSPMNWQLCDPARPTIDFSVELGGLQCVTDPGEAAERDERMIASRKDPSEAPPIPNPPHRLGPGLLHEGDPLVGTLSVQGRVRSGGRTGLFDEVLGGGWTVLSLAAADPRDVLDEERLAFLDELGARPVRVTPEGESDDGAVVDLDGGYAEWFEGAGVEAIVIRPDFYVYGTARTMAELPWLVSSLRSSLGPAEPTPASETNSSGGQPPSYDAAPETSRRDAGSAGR